MFTFHWSELLVVGVCSVVLFLGLALLMLRRRNEILEKFLTPEEPTLEEEFFRVRTPIQEEVHEDDDESETSESAEESQEESVHWGDETTEPPT